MTNNFGSSIIERFHGKGSSEDGEIAIDGVSADVEAEDGCLSAIGGTISFKLVLITDSIINLMVYKLFIIISFMEELTKCLSLMLSHSYIYNVMHDLTLHGKREVKIDSNYKIPVRCEDDLAECISTFLMKVTYSL